MWGLGLRVICPSGSGLRSCRELSAYGDLGADGCLLRLIQCDLGCPSHVFAGGRQQGEGFTNWETSGALWVNKSSPSSGQQMSFPGHVAAALTANAPQ